jgi:hypothetical protein
LIGSEVLTNNTQKSFNAFDHHHLMFINRKRVSHSFLSQRPLFVWTV